MRLIKVQVVNDTGATVTVAYGELESGVWDSQPVPGTAIAPDEAASFSTGVTDIFEPLDDSVSPSGAAGTAFDTTWSWQLEAAADLSATVTAGAAATQIHAEDPRSDLPPYVVTLKKAPQ
ncbi:hypothetical protein ACFOGJ_12405 [Marinibaculum pumilum]|uniref:Uncharacterized protein n=1 Tax=Marinibaculum pumilum TaxID=1766165 RepID=A0ABV7L077_9PROT